MCCFADLLAQGLRPPFPNIPMEIIPAVRGGMLSCLLKGSLPLSSQSLSQSLSQSQSQSPPPPPIPPLACRKAPPAPFPQRVRQSHKSRARGVGIYSSNVTVPCVEFKGWGHITGKDMMSLCGPSPVSSGTVDCFFYLIQNRSSQKLPYFMENTFLDCSCFNSSNALKVAQGNFKEKLEVCKSLLVLAPFSITSLG